YWNEPSPLFATEPCAGCVNVVTLIGSLSGSESFARTTIFKGVFSSVNAVSFTATGGRLIGTTAGVALAAQPEEFVTVKFSVTLPLAPAVNVTFCVVALVGVPPEIVHA